MKVLAQDLLERDDAAQTSYERVLCLRYIQENPKR